MSVQRALQFIRQVRTDPGLREQVHRLGHVDDLEAIVRIAAAAGFEQSAEDLQAAFKHDWAMRWVHLTARRPHSSPP
jgi:predicted ribosomally synthesized peptide with nif11-like leader